MPPGSLRPLAQQIIDGAAGGVAHLEAKVSEWLLPGGNSAYEDLLTWGWSGTRNTTASATRKARPHRQSSGCWPLPLLVLLLGIAAGAWMVEGDWKNDETGLYDIALGCVCGR